MDTLRVSEEVPLSLVEKNAPETPACLEEHLLVQEAMGKCRLSPATRAALERAVKEKKGKKSRKKYTRRRGTVHPKTKEATAKRKYKREWFHNPFSCILAGYGSKKLDREQWDRLIAPLWKQYNPADLTVRRHRGCGTRERPLTVYTLDVVHVQLGPVYRGNDQLLYDLSLDASAS